MAPAHEIAHVGPVELFTPAPDESLRFFTQVMGLTENGTDGDSVYLRTWDDYQHHTLKLTAHHTSGVGRTSMRTNGQEALDRRVRDHRVLPHPRHATGRARLTFEMGPAGGR